MITQVRTIIARKPYKTNVKSLSSSSPKEELEKHYKINGNECFCNPLQAAPRYGHEGSPGQPVGVLHN